MSKIEVYQEQQDGIVRTGIRVHDDHASLQDLLEAWQPLCDDTALYKYYGQNNGSVCRGCTANCCDTAYVIPDLIAFKRMAAYLGLGYADFIRDYFQTEKTRRGLLRMLPEPCVFLKERICTIYPLRSLICRFYLCTPLMGDTEQLIYDITWTGITATRIFAERHNLIEAPCSGGYTSFDLLFNNLIEEYRYHTQVQYFMTAHDYADVPLAPFLEAEK
ncbi:MAG: YkgJ family cysteine cluster protein [Syntrophomonadaceae bacterium]|jgi:Fe-S-cluster containining protein